MTDESKLNYFKNSVFNNNLVSIKQSEGQVNISSLKKNWKCQNFTSLLNKPEEYSLLKDFKTRMFGNIEGFDPEKELTSLEPQVESKEEFQLTNTPIIINNSTYSNFSVFNTKKKDKNESFMNMTIFNTENDESPLDLLKKANLDNSPSKYSKNEIISTNASNTTPPPEVKNPFYVPIMII